MTAARKRFRDGQDRNGNPERRRLEYRAVAYNVKTRKDKFMARLQRRIRPVGECLCYDGSLDHKGYARLTLSYKPSQAERAQVVVIHAHRLFLILKLGRAIKKGHEGGHTEVCQHRTCVKHVEEQHFKENCLTAHKRTTLKEALAA